MPRRTQTPANEDTRTRATLAITALAALATFLDTTVLFVAFPDIRSSFPDAARGDLSWVLNGYTIAFAALLIPAGKAADRAGHKRAFLTGSATFTAASVACGLAPTVPLLTSFRVVQAAGAAVLLPSSLALLLRASPPHRVPRAVAIWGATGAVAGAVGPTLGAAVVESAGWRWVFYINIPVGIVTVVAGSRLLSESRDDTARLPHPAGVALIAGAAALLSYTVVRTEDRGWLDTGTALGLLVGGALLASFVVTQRRSRRPVLDLELFALRNFAWGNAATTVFSIGFTAMFLGSILFLTSVWEWSVLKAGFGVAPGPLLVAVLAPRVGGLAGRVGQRPLIVAGGLAFAVGGLWRAVALNGHADYLVDYLPSMCFTGLGVVLCLPQLSSVVAQSLPPDRLGVGGATNQALRQFGGTFGVALTIAFIGEPAGTADMLAGFDLVWLLIVVGGVATSVIAMNLARAGTGTGTAATYPSTQALPTGRPTDHPSNTPFTAAARRHHPGAP